MEGFIVLALSAGFITSPALIGVGAALAKRVADAQTRRDFEAGLNPAYVMVACDKSAARAALFLMEASAPGHYKER